MPPHKTIRRIVCQRTFLARESSMCAAILFAGTSTFRSIRLSLNWPGCVAPVWPASDDRTVKCVPRLLGIGLHLSLRMIG